MKKYHHLTKEQRYTISVCLKKKMSPSDIARLINIYKSTVSREIDRNSNMYGHYVAVDAQQLSERRKSVPRRPRQLSKEDWQEIEQCRLRHCSTETIVGTRKREGKACVSAERLYQFIRLDKERGGTLYTWEKGLIENTNKLIRQYIHKNTDFSSLSDEYILYVQTELNLRPRKLLNVSSPKQKFFLSLHNSVALRC